VCSCSLLAFCKYMRHCDQLYPQKWWRQWINIVVWW
jgi:hypothetical protein